MHESFKREEIFSCSKKTFGTCHIAFGNSAAIGGKVYSKIHIDAILFKPSVFADEKMIMKNGKLMI